MLEVGSVYICNLNIGAYRERETDFKTEYKTIISGDHVLILGHWPETGRDVEEYRILYQNESWFFAVHNLTNYFENWHKIC